ncbi:MAG: hypothetical protein IT353_00820 [Gemmatimonadaceae bacterium]|nr:hypothetical protein [Gemmatimonadaceae bacterium]
MNANFGLLDELDGASKELLRDKARKRVAFAERGLAAMQAWLSDNGLTAHAYTADRVTARV